MPTEAELLERTERVLESVPPGDGVLVIHWPTSRRLAYRPPAHPVSDHHAVLVVLDGPEPIGPRGISGHPGGAVEGLRPPNEGLPWGME
jgi:hypothetical protein